MNTLVDQVVWQAEAIGSRPLIETCLVMTRRIRWVFITRSRTTVLPGDDCGSTPGFIVWWKSDDPTVLQFVHDRMVETIRQIGFTKPAVWCERRLENKSPRSLEYFWQEQLGDAFRYYRKAT